MIELEDGRMITEDEYKIIEAIRKLRFQDKIIISTGQARAKITWTVIRQDQQQYDR